MRGSVVLLFGGATFVSAQLIYDGFTPSMFAGVQEFAPVAKEVTRKTVKAIKTISYRLLLCHQCIGFP